MKSYRVSAIAAVSHQKRAIGRDNKLLWHLPGDLPRLRKITWGHPVIMGRKTLTDHMGHVLKGRTNIVITRDANFTFPGAVVATSLEEALTKAKESPGADEIFIFGGAQTYALALPQTDRLYLTVVYDEPAADAFFPDYSEFKKVIEDSGEMKSEQGIVYRYLTLERDTALDKGK